MNDRSFSQILEAVRGTQTMYSKLTLLVGTMGAGKTAGLRQIASALGCPSINLNLLLSHRLLDLTLRQRALQAGRIATEIVEEHAGTGICLDNTELLFDSRLKLNPLRLLLSLSRNRVLVAAWNGRYEGGHLCFAGAGHPDEYAQIARGFPIVTLQDSEAALHLSA